ncbi:MAG: site-specific integrase [Desulfomicrobium sp.]|nr:site-specific integrase [Pseudomonadota bacterium]MBV1710784.1 site-specific integrase [Desulfomicrobium sp.]MBU4570392.1 site-specific integrase [Pseudomonadota bacterium]MBU4593313.1 site-specific integrase [Pseudomonadota bacterium]MBV1721575.1 site-specific integrase [Desulfomicrobium sp.]
MREYIKSKYPGVRYREHETRKSGRGPDKYIVIRYTVNGKTVQEALGWVTQGGSIERAADILGALKQNHRTGIGPQSLAEMRAMAKAEREKNKAAHAVPSTLGDLFKKYIGWAEKNKKSWKSDREIYENRLAALRETPLASFTPAIIAELKDGLSEKYAPASVRHALALIRRMWRWAGVQWGDAWADSMPADPLRGVKMPHVKNQRLRYLFKEEVEKLLGWCAANDPQLHDIIMLSLYTGMRRDEMSFLQVGHVDLSAMLVNIVDPKSGVSLETVSVPDHLVSMLTARTKGRKNTDHVFPSAATGERMTNMSVRFAKAAAALGLNKDIIDDRYKVTLHSFRHTFISWAVKAGIDLRTVQEMARHRSFEMTLRYSHLAPRACRDAVNRLPKVAN